MAPPHTPRRTRRLRKWRGKFAPQNRQPEADTVRKNRFFSAIDYRGEKTKNEVYEELGIFARTVRSWLKQRDQLGSPAL